MKATWAVPVIASISFLTIISIIPSSYAQVLFSDNFDDNDISEYQQFGVFKKNTPNRQFGNSVDEFPKYGNSYNKIGVTKDHS